jgi:hypothetical protein
MAKRKVGSQTGNLLLEVLGIDAIPVRVGGVQHTVGKLLTKVTTLLQTSDGDKV